MHKLRALAGSGNQIAIIMALRDVAIILLGFGHLLRRSEIVQVRLSDVSVSKGTLMIPRSKTDQADRGQTVPLLPTMPVLGDVAEFWHRLRESYALMGWRPDQRVCVRYNSTSKALER